jgi:alkyl sulfatase BDS1-like metallo-beta-lactamase superfamily hydrolase
MALRGGQNQLALELTDVVLCAEPRNRLARRVRVIALKRLGAGATNGVARNIFLTAAREGS